jgi:hypothetical protein
MEQSRQETAELAEKIRTALQNIISGGCSDEEARALYRSLSGRYKDLYQKMQPSRGDSLPGLCYCHNTENFSLHTGIFLTHDNGVSRIASYGIESADQVILDVIQSLKESLRPKFYRVIRPIEGTGLKQNLHVYVFQSSEKSLAVIVALSSSPHFNKKSFIYYGNFLETLFPDRRQNPYGTSNVFHAIEKQMETVSTTHDLYAYLVYFQDLDRIFSHTGIHSLFDVSASIQKNLTDAWGEQHQPYALSLKEYAVLISAPKGDAVPVEERRIDFSFNKIPLPHHAAFLRLDKGDAFYTLTEALFSLSRK